MSFYPVARVEIFPCNPVVTVILFPSNLSIGIMSAKTKEEQKWQSWQMVTCVEQVTFVLWIVNPGIRTAMLIAK